MLDNVFNELIESGATPGVSYLVSKDAEIFSLKCHIIRRFLPKYMTCRTKNAFVWGFWGYRLEF